eukprot:277411-Ditylum_brightwellii.AAC.1
MSGETGSLRYMAPEVYKCQPYNLSADIYSLSILMYEVLSLRKPYGNTVSAFYNNVIVKGNRPSLRGLAWPQPLNGFITSMWDGDLVKRPKSDVVVMTLEMMLRGPDVGLYPRS